MTLEKIMVHPEEMYPDQCWLNVEVFQLHFQKSQISQWHSLPNFHITNRTQFFQLELPQ